MPIRFPHGGFVTTRLGVTARSQFLQLLSEKLICSATLAASASLRWHPHHLGDSNFLGSSSAVTGCERYAPLSQAESAIVNIISEEPDSVRSLCSLSLPVFGICTAFLPHPAAEIGPPFERPATSAQPGGSPRAHERCLDQDRPGSTHRVGQYCTLSSFMSL